MMYFNRRSDILPPSAQTGQTPLDVARNARQIKTAALLEAFLRAEPAHEVIAEAGTNVRRTTIGYPAKTRYIARRDQQAIFSLHAPSGKLGGGFFGSTIAALAHTACMYGRSLFLSSCSSSLLLHETAAIFLVLMLIAVFV